MVSLYTIMAKEQRIYKVKQPQKLPKPLKLQKLKESHTVAIESILEGQYLCLSVLLLSRKKEIRIERQWVYR